MVGRRSHNGRTGLGFGLGRPRPRAKAGETDAAKTAIKQYPAVASPLSNRRATRYSEIGRLNSLTSRLPP